MSKFKLSHYDKYIGLVLFCVQKHSKTSILDHWDLVQAGLLGLSKGLKIYDKRKCPEKYWVYRFINSEIIKARYKNNKERKEDSGKEKFLSKLVSDIKSPLEILEDKEETEIKQKQYNRIYKCLLHVTRNNKLNRQIYIERILEGKQLTEIAREYNLSYSSITHRIASITNQIKNCLGRTFN